ncbi:translation initiation factor IF-2 [Nonomuraea wenchangensis]|uniref:Translation initiation factor IF-2 n=1 Tax=Nonomuraea wenchangensis TaxID=568860 RepID=A0A1I0BX94_9ACTN|nr:translation initiation factor IF-2 [Nonomuraea wenchangensis]
MRARLEHARPGAGRRAFCRLAAPRRCAGPPDHQARLAVPRRLGSGLARAAGRPRHLRRRRRGAEPAAAGGGRRPALVLLGRSRGGGAGRRAAAVLLRRRPGHRAASRPRRAADELPYGLRGLLAADLRRRRLPYARSGLHGGRLAAAPAHRDAGQARVGPDAPPGRAQRRGRPPGPRPGRPVLLGADGRPGGGGGGAGVAARPAAGVPGGTGADEGGGARRAASAALVAPLPRYVRRRGEHLRRPPRSPAPSTAPARRPPPGPGSGRRAGSGS